MKLTPARKYVLSQYLFATVSRWAAVFGVVNVFAILISLGYVFFILPQKASDQAQILLRQELASQQADLKKNFGDMIIEVGRVSGHSEAVLATLQRITQAQVVAEQTQKDNEKRIAALNAQLISAETSDVGAISKFVADFNTNQEAKGLITRLNTLEQTVIRFGDGLALECERHPGLHLHAGSDKNVTVDSNALSSPFVRWTIERAPAR